MTTKTKTRSRPASSSALVATAVKKAVVVKSKPRPTPVSAVPRVTAKAKVRTATALNDNDSLAELLQVPPGTMEDYLLRIRALGDRVSGCVEFMCAIEAFTGTCVDNKRRSVAQFYDRLVLLDRELCRIREELQLA